MSTNNATIKILDKEYRVLDVLEHITIPDSFVMRNKIGKGHGEAKLYLGSRQNETLYKKFFNRFKNSKGFFLKKDFDTYLDDSKLEYEIQEQIYIKNIKKFWVENKKNVNELQDIEPFGVNESLAGGEDRFYIEDPKTNAYKIFRTIMLPTITYVAILKLQCTLTKDIKFYFRPFLDYYYDKRNFIERKQMKQLKEKQQNNTEKFEKIKTARNGQGKYRQLILKEFPAGCLITNISDERILIASHIKPWADSNNNEKIDKYNGLLLTPTYDKLFDQGFISFSPDGVLDISPYISPLNWSKLKLIKGKKYNLDINEIRAKYLRYHKEKIFKS